MRTYYAQYYQTNRERILTQSRAATPPPAQSTRAWHRPAPVALRAVTFTHGRVLVLFD
jgi:hypothetical protein